MFSSQTNLETVVSDFHIDQMMRYSLFVPRLYNLCRSLGFEAGKMMPSRAFCSDENQGFPVILIAKHFGAFPFNHGMVGGIVATDRHGPHAHHGKDVVIIQASHVGYLPETQTFGHYCRLQTAEHSTTDTCGKIGGVLKWYQSEYKFARSNIFLGHDGTRRTVTIDNQLMNDQRSEGLFLDLDKLVKGRGGKLELLRTLSTSRVYAAGDFSQSVPDEVWNADKPVSIGQYLKPDLFAYRHKIKGDVEGQGHLEANLINAMPWIVTAKEPMLVAAQVNTQAEFDRAFRTIVKEPEYQNKRLLFISCLNIDISPREGQVFPLTKCVPWAAYIQDQTGEGTTMEQGEIIDLLLQQSVENPDQIDLEEAIQSMIDAQEVKISL